MTTPSRGGAVGFELQSDMSFDRGRAILRSHSTAERGAGAARAAGRREQDVMASAGIKLEPSDETAYMSSLDAMAVSHVEEQHEGHTQRRRSSVYRQADLPSGKGGGLGSLGSTESLRRTLSDNALDELLRPGGSGSKAVEWKDDTANRSYDAVVEVSLPKNPRQEPPQYRRLSAGSGAGSHRYVTTEGSDVQFDEAAYDTSARKLIGPIPMGMLFETVAAGGEHSAAIGSGGRLFTWGSNASGQLGLDPATAAAAASRAPARLHRRIIRVSQASATFDAAAGGTLAMCDVEVVKDTEVIDSLRLPVLSPTVAIPRGVAAVACGRAHTLAALTGGGLMAWGQNDCGQVPSFEGVDVRGLSAGPHHSACVVSGGPGAVWTWGSPQDGRLGHSADAGQSAPPREVRGTGHDRVRQVACGHRHTLVLLESGKLFSFGYGGEGALGHGSRDSLSTPAIVAALRPPVRIVSIAASDVSMAADSEGLLWVWGRQPHVSHPDEADQSAAVPMVLTWLRELPAGGAVRAVACGARHAAVVTDSGVVVAWGAKDDLLLGTKKPKQHVTKGGSTWHTVRYHVCREEGMGDRIAAAVACGGHHTLALCTPAPLQVKGPFLGEVIRALYEWYARARQAPAVHGAALAVSTSVEALKAKVIARADSWDRSRLLSELARGEGPVGPSPLVNRPHLPAAMWRATVTLFLRECGVMDSHTTPGTCSDLLDRALGVQHIDVAAQPAGERASDTVSYRAFEETLARVAVRAHPHPSPNGDSPLLLMLRAAVPHLRTVDQGARVGPTVRAALHPHVLDVFDLLEYQDLLYRIFAFLSYGDLSHAVLGQPRKDILESLESNPKASADVADIHVVICEAGVLDAGGAPGSRSCSVSPERRAGKSISPDRRRGGASSRGSPPKGSFRGRSPPKATRPGSKESYRGGAAESAKNQKSRRGPTVGKARIEEQAQGSSRALKGAHSPPVDATAQKRAAAARKVQPITAALAAAPPRAGGHLCTYSDFIEVLAVCAVLNAQQQQRSAREGGEGGGGGGEGGGGGSSPPGPSKPSRSQMIMFAPVEALASLAGTPRGLGRFTEAAHGVVRKLQEWFDRTAPAEVLLKARNLEEVNVDEQAARVFSVYCGLGEVTHNVDLDLSAFRKFAKDCKICDASITPKDIDFLFYRFCFWPSIREARTMDELEELHAAASGGSTPKRSGESTPSSLPKKAGAVLSTAGDAPKGLGERLARQFNPLKDETSYEDAGKIGSKVKSGGESRKSLAFPQFRASLGEVARIKYPTSGEEGALQLLFQEYIIPVSEAVMSKYDQYSEQLLDNDIKGVIERYGESLQSMFNLYCRGDQSLNTTGQRDVTWAAVKEANASMSFVEMITFGQDKSIIPGLLQRRELEITFRKANFGLGQDNNFHDLSYQEFLDALGLMAITAFSKPEWDGKYTSPAEKLEALLKHCGLRPVDTHQTGPRDEKSLRLQQWWALLADILSRPLPPPDLEPLLVVREALVPPACPPEVAELIDAAHDAHTCARIQEAVALLDEARAVWTEMTQDLGLTPSGELHAAHRIFFICSSAAALETNGQDTEALARLEEAMSEVEKLDEGNPYGAIAHASRGTAQHHAVDPVGAFKSLANALVLRETSPLMGPSHPDTAVAYNNMAAVLDGLRRHDVAIALLERAWEVFARQLGQHHPRAALVASNLSRARRKAASFSRPPAGALPPLAESRSEPALHGPSRPSPEVMGEVAKLRKAAAGIKARDEKSRRAAARGGAKSPAPPPPPGFSALHTLSQMHRSRRPPIYHAPPVKLPPPAAPSKRGGPPEPPRALSPVKGKKKKKRSKSAKGAAGLDSAEELRAWGEKP